MGLIFECDICKSRSSHNGTMVDGLCFCNECTQRQSIADCVKEVYQKQKEDPSYMRKTVKHFEPKTINNFERL